MASPTLITPTPKPLQPIKSKLCPPSAAICNPASSSSSSSSTASFSIHRRDLVSGVLTAGFVLLSPVTHALAASDEEYARETAEAIGKVRATMSLEKNDPNVADAVAELRELSNSWVAKYRKEKTLLSRASFREMYSALNAVSGHYISFGPTAPIPAKRKQRILEEMDTAEKALSRGR